MTPLLEITGLRVDYPGRGWRAQPHQVLHGVSLDVRPGETVGIVGESGSGKTTLGRAVLGLVPVAAGRILYGERDITRLPRRERRGLAADIQVVFQDPYGSLNPAHTIGDILTEPLGRAGTAKIGELLDLVGLPADTARRLPREFSGGQRQRIAIARALALNPKIIVCDEPVSALDLSTQARIHDLLLDIQESAGVAYLFISHDLAVVRHLSHRVAVLYRGEIVEHGTGDQVTSQPEHPYTRRLLMSTPVPDPDLQAVRRAERHT